MRLLFRQGVRLLIGLIVAALPARVLSPGLAGGLSCLLFCRLLQPRSARMPAVVASALRRSEVRAPSVPLLTTERGRERGGDVNSLTSVRGTVDLVGE